MLKNKFVLTVLFILAFMVFLVPESHATFDVNGVTLPDLPDTLPSDEFFVDYGFKSFDYVIYDRDSSDTSYNMHMFLYVDENVDADFYLIPSRLNQFYINPNGHSYIHINYMYTPGEHDSWVSTGYNTELQTEKKYFDIGSDRNISYSSADIYTNSNLDEIFFQKTPSTIPTYPTVTYPTVEEMVKEETPKMAVKILEAMKILVVFSISCLILLILLQVFSRVFSIFRVR